jgi:medium-chain acyl-[acyl-carrier-protein] hydrolase
LIHTLADELKPYLQPPFAFFGHSLGGIIAYELCRELRRRKEPIANHLFVSAVAAPDLGYCRPLHKLPDDELAQEISQLGGTPRAVLEDLGMRDMVLSLVRVDLKLLETRTYVDEAPLNCPITAFGSASDTRTSMDELKAWQRHTSQAFRLQEFPGGHFYFKDQDIRQRLFAEIVATLSIPEALS